MTKSTTILVVEDEPLIRMELVDELTDRDFAVIEASGAREAIELLWRHPEIQIMFTDIDMPGGMDGLMLAAAVRDRWPPIKIIVTSGLRRVDMDDMPADSRFFSKPYRFHAVASAIREMLS